MVNVRRENNFDLLRIMCAIAIVTIHVSGIYLETLGSNKIFGGGEGDYAKHIFVLETYNVLSRFAVPCFCMLSGAFIIADKRNVDYKFFYRKSFKNIGVYTVIFSFIYFAYSMLLRLLGIILGIKDVNVLFEPVKDLLLGLPYYHMWYLYMLIGVYLFAPFVIRFKQDIGEKNFSKIVWPFLLAACLSNWTSTYKLNWDIGLSFTYLGYFMIGYEIRKIGRLHKNNMKSVILISLGIITELIVTFLCYKKELEPYNSDFLNIIASKDPFAPLIMVAALLIFMGFSMLEIKKDFSKLASYTFLIYLVHAGIWDIYKKGIAYYFGVEGDNMGIIPIFIIIVLLTSFVFAVIYERVWGFLENKFAISDKLLHIVHLG